MDIGRDYNGHDGARQLMETLTEGMETEIVITQLYTFRDGLILRIDGFPSRDEALEAAGLAESGRLDLNQRPFGPQSNALPDWGGMASGWPRHPLPDRNRASNCASNSRLRTELRAPQLAAGLRAPDDPSSPAS